ncbi:MAG TPA: aminotransferase class V-fold PLP-dependent enzyme [Miltoncostaeaceae bacterium]|nr:aminotransferase class V-fold PLP-dependent enzyme [Miltoncostaeaceae bacterium]
MTGHDAGAAAYLDHAAAARSDPRVAEAMAAALREGWASPSALHGPGARAAALVEEARAEVAALVGAEPDEILFTSGTTESRVTAVRGLLAGAGDARHVVASDLEHPAVLWVLGTGDRRDEPWAAVAPDGDGRLDPEAVMAAVRPDTGLVALHHGQADLGTVQDAPALVAAARAARPEVRVHVDAAETAGVLPLDLGVLGADAVTLGGPAMGGPPWTAALWVRPGARMHPLMGGGLQEGGKRAGAEAVPGIAGLGAAARIARAGMEARARHRRALAARLLDGLLALEGVRRNGPPADARLPGHVQVSVAGVRGETLALALAGRGVCVSPGSTCTAAADRPAPALEAIGLGPEWNRGGVLFTLGPEATAAEVAHALSATREVVPALRALGPGAPP